MATDNKDLEKAETMKAGKTGKRDQVALGRVGRTGVITEKEIKGSTMSTQ